MKMKLGLLLLVVIWVTPLFASEVSTGITSEGACAIVGMSAEQCQLIALQRARAAAIEQAAGVRVISSTLVTNSALAMDIIKTFSHGYVVKEKAEWLPLGQYQKDSTTPPIPEYRVKLISDVKVMKHQNSSLGLSAKMNRSLYRSGEKAFIEISVARDARYAIFNITADDQVAMLFPNQHDSDNRLKTGTTLRFPKPTSSVELEMQTLPGHSVDNEAILVVAFDEQVQKRLPKLFDPLKHYNFTDFFANYVELAENANDLLLTYQVNSGS
jgi:hypothetical protein